MGNSDGNIGEVINQGNEQQQSPIYFSSIFHLNEKMKTVPDFHWICLNWCGWIFVRRWAHVGANETAVSIRSCSNTNDRISVNSKIVFLSIIHLQFFSHTTIVDFQNSCKLYHFIHFTHFSNPKFIIFLSQHGNFDSIFNWSINLKGGNVLWTDWKNSVT